MPTKGMFQPPDPGPTARIPRTALAVAVILIVIGLSSVGCVKQGPGTARTTDELLVQLKEDRNRIDQTTDTMMQRIDQFNASRKPGEPTLQFSEIFSQDLSPEQRDVLNAMVEQEKDVSYQALLQKIIADRDTIRGLQENVMRLEQSLNDTFVLVKRGDRHEDLAMTYLTEQAKLTPDQAKARVKQIDLTDELVPGNKVWFFFDPEKDLFRTYVTQGEAGQTPLAVRRAKQRQLIQERDAYKTERDVAQAEVVTLQANKEDLEASNAELAATKAQLAADLATRQNSLYYHAANKQTLKDQGVLSGVLSKVKDVRAVNYDESVDLRQATTINLLPESYGLSEIREVRVLPSIYREGRDFSVQTTEDHRSAQLVILDPELFRGKEVLLVIGG